MHQCPTTEQMTKLAKQIKINQLLGARSEGNKTLPPTVKLTAVFGFGGSGSVAVSDRKM